jgi:uncharacterized protein DUF955
MTDIERVYKDAEGLAKKLHHVLGVTRAPVSEQLLVNYIRDNVGPVAIRYVPMLDREQCSGRVRWKDGTWFIEVNLDERPVRRKLTIGHECIHILQVIFSGEEPKEGVIAYRMQPQSDPLTRYELERHAERTAAAFFVPLPWVETYMKTLREPNKLMLRNKLASIAQVSAPLMGIRLSEAGLYAPQGSVIEDPLYPVE